MSCPPPGKALQPGCRSDDAAVVAVPELEVLAGVARDVVEVGLGHLAHGLGGDAHHERAGGHHLAGRHHGPGPDLGVVFDDGAGEDDGADPDADVVADGAGVHDGAMADGHALADDARVLGGDVHHRVVLHVGVAADADVVVLVAAHDREGPDAHTLGQLHVADDQRGGIDPGLRMDARRAARHRADRHATRTATPGWSFSMKTPLTCV